VRESAQVWCWGYNYNGHLGVGDTGDQWSPTQVGSSSDWANVAAGDYHSCGIATSGALSCWGYNFLGEVGVGDLVPRTTPTPVTG
jgi:alpha-tubulin suppressor-like RCC1 family protein